MNKLLIVFIVIIFNSNVRAQISEPVSFELSDYESYFKSDSLFSAVFIKEAPEMKDDLYCLSIFLESSVKKINSDIAISCGWKIGTDSVLVRKYKQYKPYKNMLNLLSAKIERLGKNDPNIRSYLSAFAYICLLEANSIEK